MMFFASDIVTDLALIFAGAVAGVLYGVGACFIMGIGR